MTSLAILVDMLTAYRFHSVDESELRDGIANVLAAAHVPFAREYPLDGIGRLDFFVRDPHGIAIEVKTRGSRSELARQVMRYAVHHDVRAILVVTTRLQHRLPPLMAGKPVRILALPRGLR